MMPAIGYRLRENLNITNLRVVYSSVIFVIVMIIQVGTIGTIGTIYVTIPHVVCNSRNEWFILPFHPMAAHHLS